MLEPDLRTYGRLHGVHRDTTLFHAREVFRRFGASTTAHGCHAISPYTPGTSKQVTLRTRDRHVALGTTAKRCAATNWRSAQTLNWACDSGRVSFTAPLDRTVLLPENLVLAVFSLSLRGAIETVGLSSPAGSQSLKVMVQLVHGSHLQKESPVIPHL
ncbi:hypothetical protein EYF80_004003 [Liparis tanakae]|uniref:Uncharacterized protein n=1 Tax=Liparis tanakae TaxID=230148 RepID=A0A4Z2J6E8_9TELE|nr:hypothetical protein EYF80_004003 [Liparis tanakae]